MTESHDNIIEFTYPSIEISAFDPNIYIQLPGREMMSISRDEVERMSHDNLDDSEVVSDDEFDDESIEMMLRALGLREMENEVPNKPTPKTVVENLRLVTVTKDDVDKDNAICAICKDDMGVGEKAKLLPCLHCYHGGCIDQWLGIRNTCPVCRYEFPVDDPESEESGGGTRNLSCEVPE